jgi:hypothetical protein
MTEDLEKARQRKRRWHERHKDERREYNEAHKEEKSRYNRRYAQEHPDKKTSWEYEFRAVAVKRSTRDKAYRLAKRYHIRMYQLFDILVSEHLEGFKEKQVKVNPDEYDEKDKEIFKVFNKL